MIPAGARFSGKNAESGENAPPGTIRAGTAQTYFALQILRVAGS